MEGAKENGVRGKRGEICRSVLGIGGIYAVMCIAEVEMLVVFESRLLRERELDQNMS